MVLVHPILRLPKGFRLVPMAAWGCFVKRGLMVRLHSVALDGKSLRGKGLRPLSSCARPALSSAFIPCIPPTYPSGFPGERGYHRPCTPTVQVEDRDMPRPPKASYH